MRRLTCAALAALLIFPVAAGAQESQPGERSESRIVVTGSRVKEEEVRDFVRALTPAPGGSIPRFIDEVCPVVVGLVPAQNQAIAARMRQVAAATGLAVGKPGCPPNAFVIVTRDKRAFIEALANQRPHSFGMMTARQIRRLARSPGPAAAWQLTGPVDSNGIPLGFDEEVGYINDTTEPASRIRSTSSLGFDASAVVVETRALEGLTATQLADYASMRLLAQLDPGRLPQPAPPSILSILEAPMGSEIPITMTQWDLGLLRGLYASASNLNPSSRRSEIVRQVTQQIGASER